MYQILDFNDQSDDKMKLTKSEKVNKYLYTGGEKRRDDRGFDKGNVSDETSNIIGRPED